MTAPTRRGLLAGAAGLTVAPAATSVAAAAQPHPDAVLLVLAERFIAHERLVQAIPCDAETDAEEAVQKAEQRRLLDYKHWLVMQMGKLRAITADGITARARCLAIHNADGAHSMDAPETATGRLLRWLMRDAAALGRSGMETPVTSPDATLLEACAAFDRLERAYQDSYDGAAEEGPEWEAAQAERERLMEAQAPWLEQIVAAQAITLAGVRAKAARVVLWDEEALEAHPDYTADRIRSSLLRDLTGAT